MPRGRDVLGLGDKLFTFSKDTIINTTLVFMASNWVFDIQEGSGQFHCCEETSEINSRATASFLMPCLNLFSLSLIRSTRRFIGFKFESIWSIHISGRSANVAGRFSYINIFPRSVQSENFPSFTSSSLIFSFPRSPAFCRRRHKTLSSSK